VSVINKMLRDLDQRQMKGGYAPADMHGRSARAGTAGLAADLPREGLGKRRLAGNPTIWALAISAVLALALGAWWWVHGKTTAVPAPVPAPAVAAAVQVPQPAASMAVSPPPAIALTGSASVRPVDGDAAIAGVDAKTLKKSKAVEQSQQKKVEPEQMGKQASLDEAAKTVAEQQAPIHKEAATPGATNGVVTSDAASQTTGLRQLAAAREAQAQAQALWSAGSYDAAIDLLQDALASAERNAQNTQGVAALPSGAAIQTLSAMALDLAHMLLTQGRAGASADMLARLEPLLPADAEVWATRANAAQRAGRHQESVKAYTRALELRPEEQRWLLGAAVSLAALGQTSSAAAQLEKAASLGPISKDVLAYLRQAGVRVKD